jgi:hypothetical protein
VPLCSDDCQRDRCQSGNERSQAHAREVNVAVELHLLAREEMQGSQRKGGKSTAEGKQGNRVEGGPPQPHVSRMIG